MSGLTKNPLAGLAALGLAGMAPSNTGGLNPTGKFMLIPITDNTNIDNTHIGNCTDNTDVCFNC